MGLRRFTSTLKPWQSILALIIAVGGVFAVGYQIYRYFEKRNNCQTYVTAAEKEFSKDNFDTALEHLNTARTQCVDDKDIDARYTRVETFKEAAAYDQVRLVKDPTILTKINKNLEVLRIHLGDTEDLLVLKALYEELMDRPNKAVDIYKEAVKQRANYAKIYNSWGYTIFKWKLGGSGWSDQALEKFKRAAGLQSDYGWPHMNMAAVYLELAENALTDNRDLDGAKKFLPDAKTSLEVAERLLPTNPRVDLLWGHYHIIQARIFSDRGLTLEARDSYSKAKEKLGESKDKNKQIADARILLGSVYLELGMVDEAVYEFNEAVKLDDMNITACARLVFGLSKKLHSHPEKTESEQIAAQIKRGLDLINTLRQRFTARKNETNDTDAKEWLATTVRSYEPLEEFLKDAEQVNAVARTKSKPKAK